MLIVLCASTINVTLISRKITEPKAEQLVQYEAVFD